LVKNGQRYSGIDTHSTSNQKQGTRNKEPEPHPQINNFEYRIFDFPQKKIDPKVLQPLLLYPIFDAKNQTK